MTAGSATSTTRRLLARHAGIWEGRYSHLAAADRRVVETQLFRIRVETFDSPALAYRQTSHYWWPDGREAELVYEGAYDDASDAVVIDTPRIHGTCRAIDANVLYLDFGYVATPDARIGEMIHLSADGLHRARTWHWYQREALDRVTLVRESRVSLDPQDWPTQQLRPAGYEFDRIPT